MNNFDEIDKLFLNEGQSLYFGKNKTKKINEKIHSKY